MLDSKRSETNSNPIYNICIWYISLTQVILIFFFVSLLTLTSLTNPEQVSHMPCKSLFILQGTVLRMIISRNLHGGMHYVVHFVFITFDLVGLCLPEKETNFYY